MTTKNAEKLYCSFCGKSQDEIEKLIAGPGVYICDACVRLCDDIIDEESVRSLDNSAGLSDDALLDHMARIAASRDRVDATVGTVVRQLRDRGITWARIGEALGITKQSAWERYSGEE